MNGVARSEEIVAPSPRLKPDYKQSKKASEKTGIPLKKTDQISPGFMKKSLDNVGGTEPRPYQ